MISVARPTFYRPWLYVLLGLGVSAASLFIAGERAKFAGAIALSGLLSVAPLPVIAPSPDFRYSIWCVATSLVGVALLIAAFRKLRSRPDPV
jgi:hypothetical protein